MVTIVTRASKGEALTHDEVDANFNNLNSGKAENSALTAHTSNTGNPHSTTKAQVGLGNVDNTSDANKPVSTAQQTALNGKEPTIAAGTTSQYWRGDKSWQTLNSSAVGLGNVNNTSDANKPVSTAQQAALNLKADLAGSAFTGTVFAPDVNINAISQSIHSGAVVKTFFYDTSKDSDGGAWRKRCQDKSWYNETLVTGKWLGQQATGTGAAIAAAGGAVGDYFQFTTDGKFYRVDSLAGSGTFTEIFRGNRAEFPEQVAIIAESGRVIIYDLTQANCPMWMVFVSGAFSYSTGNAILVASLSSVTALNGIILAGCNNSTDGSLLTFSFLSDSIKSQQSAAPGGLYNGSISLRNSSKGFAGGNTSLIVNKVVNDAVMTVLPDAPTDLATGLQIPTIAVATAGGLSNIHSTGSVVNSSSTSSVVSAKFDGNTLTTVRADGTVSIFNDVSRLSASFVPNATYTTSSTPATLGVSTVTA